MAIKLKSFNILSHGQTDIGLVRENNEDAWLVDPENHFFILCDGMGGHRAGEVASQETVQVLAERLKKSLGKKRRPNAINETKFLENLIQEVNSFVHSLSRRDKDLQGMGTTLCCTYIYEKNLFVGHVGDSRVYLFRENNLFQLTEDHSLVAELVELGELRAKQARSYKHKNIITRAIGTEPQVKPTVQVLELQVGDHILMCSDGLSDLLSSHDIEKILSRGCNLSQTVNELISSANHKGGNDNVTVILMKAEDGP